VLQPPYSRSRNIQALPQQTLERVLIEAVLIRIGRFKDYVITNKDNQVLNTGSTVANNRLTNNATVVIQKKLQSVQQ
jgi:hypothetical protein